MQRLAQLSAQIIEPTNKQFIYALPVGSKKQNETQAYRHGLSVNGLFDVPSSIKNLCDFWFSALNKFSNHRLIQDLTYSQVDRLTTNIGSWLSKHNHQKFYIYCKNSPQWTMTDIASWKYGLINIPLYDTLGTEAFHYILQLTQGTAIVTTSQNIQSLKSILSKEKVNVRTIIFFDSIKASDRQFLTSMNLQVVFFEQLKNFDQFQEFSQVGLDHPLLYCFTSGTTGLPKGVVETHRMIITQTISMAGFYNLTQKDVHMSYLPIAHIFERCIICACIYFGTNIQYSKHPAGQILKDLAIIKPTTIPIVPRLLNKLYPIMKQIYQKQNNNQKVIDMFGGRLRLIVTASAPVAANILTFFKNVLKCDVRQGYGQTQTTGLSFITQQGDTNFGVVGGPNICTQFKLVDVPQMNYFTSSNPPRGQVCMRGPSVFREYYRNKKATIDTVDQQGWNHSGDIGIIMPNGALKIIDRKKNIFKLSQGQYIAPEKVENIYARCKYVAESFVYGDSIRDYLVAIVHPNLQLLLITANNLGITETDISKLCQNQHIIQFVHNEMNIQAKNDGLMGFQVAKKIKLWPKSFTQYGIFTSTMKLQRFVAKKVFTQEIDKLYKK